MKLIIKELEIRIKNFHLTCKDMAFEAEGKYLIIAPNGSGKSMFLKGIIDLEKTRKRRILIDNRKIENYKLSEVFAAYLGEEFLIPFYEPKEYFELLGKTKGLNNSEISSTIKKVSEVFNDNWPKKFIRDLSTGMKKRVGLAGSLIGNPKIVLWDEPFENVDDEATQLLLDFIKNDTHLIIYTSPLMNDSLPFDKKLTIDSGKVSNT